MKKLAISFITYNRTRQLKEALDIIAQPTKEYDIDIYIFDGSTNANTEHIVKQYKKNEYNHIYYFRADRKLSIKDSYWSRLNSALVIPNTEYIWLCGDMFVIKPMYYSKIMSYIDKSYDIITIYGGILKGTRDFDEPNSFVDYAIVPITHFGSTIIKKKLIEQYDIKKSLEKNGSFGVQLIYLRAIVKNDFKGVVIDGGKQVSISTKYQAKRDWLNNVWITWLSNWYQFICLLPDAYENIRERLYNRIDLTIHFFSIEMLLLQRAEGKFDWKKYIECKEYVKKVILLPGSIVFVVAILPKKIARMIYSFICSKEYKWIRKQILNKFYGYRIFCSNKT